MEKRHKPHKDFRFWYYSPAGNGMTFFRTAEDRNEYAKKDINEYLNDAWSEEVEWCCAGEVTHSAQQIDREERPTDPVEDEDWPDDIDYRCNYKLLPLGEDK